jgi:hypothetical protein
MRLKLSFMPTCLAAAALLSAWGCASNSANSNAANAASSSSPASADANAPGRPAAAQSNAASAAPDGAAAGQPAGAGGASAAGQSNAGASKDVDACALLTSEEIKSVQGEAVRETKPSRRDDASMHVSQCFFTTATFNKSVSLEVTTSADGRSARRFWDERFGRAREESGKGEKEREREKREREKKERDADKKKEGARGEEDEEGALPAPVKGLGDEAYWAASRVNGTLYARRGDSFVRVSIGGAGSDTERLSKAKALAQKALARL